MAWYDLLFPGNWGDDIKTVAQAPRAASIPKGTMTASKPKTTSTPAPAKKGGVLPTPQPATTTATRTKGPTPVDPAAAAAASAKAEAAAAMARAGQGYQSRAGNLDPQIAALRLALDKSFKSSLDQNLKDVGTMLGEQFDLLKQGASKRALEFLEGAKNTEKASAGQAETNMSNLVRERQDSLTAVLEHGAGQTDLLRAMVGAARNWHTNAQEGNRAYFDSMQGTNAGIVDLNVDTQTALSNAYNQGETEKERLWQDFYNRRSDSFTQLGNLYTSQADLLDQAKENKVGGGGGSKNTLFPYTTLFRSRKSVV